MNAMFNRNVHLPRALIWAILVSLLLHVGGMVLVLSHTGVDYLIQGDAVEYVERAVNLYEGRGFVVQVAEGDYVRDTTRLPGFPYLLSLFLNISEKYGLEVYLVAVNIVSGILLPLLTWYIGTQLFNDRIALTAAWIIVLEPMVWIQGWFLLTDIPALLAALGMVAAYLRYIESRALTWAVPAGLLGAATLFMRPQLAPLFMTGAVMVGLYQLIKKEKVVLGGVVAAAVCVLVMVPWFLYVHRQSGVWAAGGGGWYNVYKDYLASTRSIENGTTFAYEKENLKQYAMQSLNVQRHQLSDSKYANWYRDQVVPEIAKNPDSVIRLEAMLFLTYFTNTLYYSRIKDAGLLPELPKIGVSATNLVLTEGFGAVPEIFTALKRMYFIPLLERLWALGLFVFAIIGVIVWPGRVKYVLITVMLAGYLLSSLMVGLGLEGRHRIAVLPFIFLLAAAGLHYAATVYQTMNGSPVKRKGSSLVVRKAL